VMRVFRGEAEIEDPEWFAMAIELVERSGLPVDDPDGAMAAYEHHIADVRAAVPPERLVEWHPGDGWEPICAALDAPVPNEPFPHKNAREEWIAGPVRRSPGEGLGGPT
jgi:Sulfotransferase domain